MKRKYLLLAGAALLTLFAVSSCSGQPEADAQETVSQTTETEQTSDDDALSEDAETVTEDVEVTEGTVTMDEPFGNTRIHIEMLGLQEYDKLESEKIVDEPEDGNIYLALFLNIQDYAAEDDYINAAMFTSYVDGELLDNKYLYNDPEGYPSVFQKITSGEQLNGCILWEVPEDWQELSFVYTGWEDSYHFIVKGSVTPSDLKQPVEYDASVY